MFANALYTLVIVFGTVGYNNDSVATSVSTEYQGSFEECQTIADTMNDPDYALTGRANIGTAYNKAPASVSNDQSDRMAMCIPKNSAGMADWKSYADKVTAAWKAAHSQ